MATYFVSNGTIDGAPSDSNDGLDALGIELSSAAYDDEGGAGGDYRVFSGSSFGDYTWASGDRIYLTGASITDGLYEVASKLDDDVIFLTESAGGDSAVDSSDGPFATVQHGVDTATGGDELIICGASTYAEATQIDFDTNATTPTSYARIMGATARGVVDGTRATLDFATQGAGDGFNNDSTGDASVMYVANLNILNAFRDGVFLDIGCYWAFENCRVSGSTRNGIQLDNAASSVACYGCELDSNVIGVNCSSNTRGPVVLIGCSVHDNSGDGVVYGASGTVFAHTQFYNNTGDGVARENSAEDYDRTQCTVLNCTFFNNGACGIDLEDTSSGRTIIMSSVFRSNTSYAIDTAGDADQVVLLSDNVFSDNASAGDVTLFTGHGNTTADPEFESETGGSEDLEPDSDSPLIGAGFSWSFSEGNYPQYLDKGAIQREMAAGGGGGGLLTHPGMSGGMRG